MKAIVTLTLNPTIDGAAEADQVRPIHKVRTSNERHYPGGGGVNVARVLGELGSPATAVYLAGGLTGALLDELLAGRGFTPLRVGIMGDTRISHSVYDRATGLEYRFVPEGPEVSAGEMGRAVETIAAQDFDWLVASGSLPHGLGPEAYGPLVRLAAERGARFALDTSGPALAATLAAGPVALIKPSLGELRHALGGERLEGEAEIAAAAEKLRARHGVGIVAVTLGQDGALMAGSEGILRLPAVEVPVISATGAGDSFLAGMIHALAQGRPEAEAFRLGMAAGAAAVITPGTDLCRRGDVERLAAAFGG
jgi:6-phosphofructokinase 2